MKNLLIASTSTLPDSDYMEYLLEEIKLLFSGCNEVLFIPYARPGGISHAEYTAKAATAFAKIGIDLRGINEFKDATEAVQFAQGIFTGGGNTFLLVSKLYENKLISVLTNVILNGIPYLGCSAGSNIAGQTMQTTNDMPIVYPESFTTLGLLPFNLNPHYLDPQPDLKHMGETRETRIREYHVFNETPVVGLREGSWLRVNDNTIILKGEHSARLFRFDKNPVEVASGTDLRDTSNIKA